MSELALEIRDLSISYLLPGDDIFEAVKNVSLSIPIGSTLALVGESGSGKSTLAAAVNLLLPSNGRLDSGRIMLEGREIQALPQAQMRAIRGKHVGLVPQDPM